MWRKCVEILSKNNGNVYGKKFKELSKVEKGIVWRIEERGWTFLTIYLALKI